MSESVQQMIYCRACGQQMHVSAAACPGCGAVQTPANASDKRILPAMLLCFFFGFLGVHRFYVGKIGTGILQILTLGGFGIWALIDFILIVVGAFTDSDGHKITEWT
ncbi:TM2 domain-containing protein [Undibacterium jejuense]|uniref:TM2 domain-containing protein n=1 Tax=Undibacterium jejuense TaxID=1344949 RepID=A0A923HKL7_9BURK|nr:TM2 domain-containing protein [Undibacterium jejuense]